MAVRLSKSRELQWQWTILRRICRYVCIPCTYGRCFNLVMYSWQLNCPLVHWQQNQGKCGVCGDAYHLNQPRPHEAGGEFANGIITRHYTVGEKIQVEIELTANHYGRFEIYLCPNNDPSRVTTQECFDSWVIWYYNGYLMSRSFNVVYSWWILISVILCTYPGQTMFALRFHAM